MTPNRFPSPCVEWEPGHTLSMMTNPSFYWAHMLSVTLGGISALKVDPVTGVIFSGPVGNGRHTTAEGLAGTLSKLTKNPCYCLRTTGCALDTKDVADACDVLNQVDGVIRKGTRVCLLLDSPENSRHSLAIQEYLYQLYLARKNMLFPILITEHLSNILPDLQRKLLCCHCPNPDQAARQSWLHSQFTGNIPIKFSGSTSHITIANDTGGFTWKQMTDLRTLLRRTIAFKYLESPKTYNPEMIPGLEKKLWAEGAVALDQHDVQNAIALIRSQGVPAAQGSVQYVAAAPQVSGADVSVSADDIPLFQTKKKSPEELKAEIALHINPEKLEYDDLTNIMVL